MLNTIMNLKSVIHLKSKWLAPTPYSWFAEIIDFEIVSRTRNGNGGWRWGLAREAG